MPTNKGRAYFFGNVFCFFLRMFFVFQSGAAFPAICCSLELKSVFCMHFGARIPHLSAHLAFGFWLLALLGLFSFWLLALCFLLLLLASLWSFGF